MTYTVSSGTLNPTQLNSTYGAKIIIMTINYDKQRNHHSLSKCCCCCCLLQ